tara:strand:- start:1305 stop:1748 length:444 start_codon:yes stop_codon:yes gene_type:complete
MMTILLFLGMALASDPIKRPEAPKSVDGECVKVYPINRGQPLPPPVFSPSGIAGCSAVVVPLSQFSDLLQTEQWGKSVAQQYRIKTSSLEMERDWYKDRLNLELKPKPWLERPATQRWLGRVETIVIVGIVTAGLGATYYYTSGVGK